MAEGDTIARAARRLERALAGEEVQATAPNPRGRQAGVERLDGRRLEDVETRGKHLLLGFGDLVLHSHLGMSGSWHLYDPGQRWRKPRRAAWAVLTGERAEAVQFGGSTLRVLRRESVRLDPSLSRLGPDILATDLDPGRVVELMRERPSETIGAALLDQTRVAGIGNIFKSEACFAARVDPRSRIGELADDDIERVVEAAAGLMRAAVSEGRARPAVYGRAGMPCAVCGTAIRITRQGDANRSTYWCPGCQGGP